MCPLPLSKFLLDSWLNCWSEGKVIIPDIEAVAWLSISDTERFNSLENINWENKGYLLYSELFVFKKDASLEVVIQYSIAASVKSFTIMENSYRDKIFLPRAAHPHYPIPSLTHYRLVAFTTSLLKEEEYHYSGF